MGPARKSGKGGKASASPYSAFFQRELKKIKQENPSIAHKDAFKQAGLNWRTSPENPKNQSKGVEAGASASNAAPAEPPVEKPVEVAPAKQSPQGDLVPPPLPAAVPAAMPTVASAAVPAAALAPEHAPSVPSVPLSGSPAIEAAAASNEPKPTSIPSAFGMGGIPEASANTTEARVSSPAAGAVHQAPASSKPPASRVLTPIIPSMASHSVPGALTAAK
ncbi:hypothetical protein IWW39_005932 [Coemansia spiralis]|uniref:YABBY protein C-terminal domain-containing protein n=1 Tax=Coemansia spiralis TaxID=417178 RepID=A0A9W8GGL2_9FUNG|nr:hypothetical protein IWW39_005932 [Coemansia spiralis]